jgi:uncharacterized protein YbcC (UPF0753/DUF2309 family)
MPSGAKTAWRIAAEPATDAPAITFARTASLAASKSTRATIVLRSGFDSRASNTPLQHNLHCGGCGASACSTFVMYEEQCNKGGIWTPYATDFMVRQHVE